MRRSMRGSRRWCAATTVVSLALACVERPDATTPQARAIAAERTSGASVRNDRDVQVDAGDGVLLAGTLSMPAPSTSRVVVPAALLLSGSGPQDRDGARPELAGYRPQRDLAQALARGGIATLRLDDRGMGGSTGAFAGATTLDFARDAGRAVDWLRGQPGIDPERVAVVGHSEGALVALLVASRDPHVRALVLLGAAAHSGREVARWQRQALVMSDPLTWPAPQRRAVLAAADRDAERAAANDAWLRTWFALDPRTVAQDVHSPVLLLHGDTDRQVPRAHADELAVALRAASIRAAGTADVTVLRFPSTNHLFLDDPIGDPRGYPQLPTRALRGDVTHALVAWLHGRLTR